MQPMYSSDRPSVSFHAIDIESSSIFMCVSLRTWPIYVHPTISRRLPCSRYRIIKNIKNFKRSREYAYPIVRRTWRKFSYQWHGVIKSVYAHYRRDHWIISRDHWIISRDLSQDRCKITKYIFARASFLSRSALTDRERKHLSSRVPR